MMWLINVMAFFKRHTVVLLVLIAFVAGVGLEHFRNRYVATQAELARVTQQFNLLNGQIQAVLSISHELALARNEIERQRQALEKDINYAIKSDGTAFNGIGADSLCLYKRAFGYECGADAGAGEKAR